MFEADQEDVDPDTDTNGGQGCYAESFLGKDKNTETTYIKY